MEIDISGRHFHVTEPIKQYVVEKIQKLGKYRLKLESVHVIMGVQKFYHAVEITALGKHYRFASKEQSTDMYAAFDKSFDNIQRQFRKKHEMIKEHKPR